MEREVISEEYYTTYHAQNTFKLSKSPPFTNEVTNAQRVKNLVMATELVRGGKWTQFLDLQVACPFQFSKLQYS